MSSCISLQKEDLTIASFDEVLDEGFERIRSGGWSSLNFSAA